MLYNNKLSSPGRSRKTTSFSLCFTVLHSKRVQPALGNSLSRHYFRFNRAPLITCDLAYRPYFVIFCFSSRIPHVNISKSRSLQSICLSLLAPLKLPRIHFYTHPASRQPKLFIQTYCTSNISCRHVSLLLILLVNLAK